MLLEFLAALAMGAGVAGLVMSLNWLMRRRLPGWMTPASAGLAMILMMVYLEYTWASRTEAQLPEGVVITAQSEASMWYRPWTYIKPLSLRMVAVDTRRNRHHADFPDYVMTTVLLLGRWMPAREIPVVYDCAGARRADLDASVQFADDGALLGTQWRALSDHDRALRAACVQ